MERIPTFVLALAWLFFVGFDIAIAQPIADSFSSDSVGLLLGSIGGDQGIKILGTSATGIQLLIRLLQSGLADNFFAKQKPWVRLALISTLTFAVTPLGLMAGAGLPLAAALMHTATLNAFMVFLDQMIKHAPKGKNDEE